MIAVLGVKTETEPVKAARAELPVLLKKHAEIIALMQQWRKSIKAKPKLQGVEIEHADADLYIKQWLQAIDQSRGITDSRFAKVPHLLFYGPPGSGKSYKCGQIEAQSRHIAPDVVVISIACSSLVTMMQNSGAVAMKEHAKMVAQARAKGNPVIIVLEEIHEIASINKRGGESVQDAQSSATVELNLFLDKCAHDGVLVIATTNYLEDLAPALQSRFKQQIKFGYYDEATCKRLILHDLLEEFGKSKLNIDFVKKLDSCAKDIFGVLYEKSRDIQQQSLMRIDDLLEQLNVHVYDVDRVQEINDLLVSMEQMNDACLNENWCDMNEIQKELLDFYCCSIRGYLADVRNYLKRYIFAFKQEQDVNLLAKETAGKDLRFLDALVQEIVIDSQVHHEGNITHDFIVEKIAVVKERFARRSERWSARERQEAEDIRIAVDTMNVFMQIEGRGGTKDSIEREKKAFGYEQFKKRAQELCNKIGPV